MSWLRIDNNAKDGSNILLWHGAGTSVVRWDATDAVWVVMISDNDIAFEADGSGNEYPHGGYVRATIVDPMILHPDNEPLMWMPIPDRSSKPKKPVAPRNSSAVLGAIERGGLNRTFDSLCHVLHMGMPAVKRAVVYWQNKGRVVVDGRFVRIDKDYG